MVDLIASAAYSSCFLGISLTASGLPAVILHVGSLFTKITVGVGVLLYAKKQYDEFSD